MAGSTRSVMATLRIGVPDGDPIRLDFPVLLYREDGDWCALALETDLRGYGDTMEAACKELTSALDRQFTFSFARMDPGLLIFPAEKKYFEMFLEATSKQTAESLASISGKAIGKVTVDVTPPQFAHAAG